MKRILISVVFSLGCGCIAAAAENPAAVPFQAVSFEQASQAATAEHKIILIDFFTTWCEPCKMLDRQTWTDPQVGALLGTKAIALRLDAEKDGALLAKKYTIDAYPTILLLKPDGTEIDRLVGFREPKVFITEMNDALAGRNAVRRAQEAVERSKLKEVEEQVKARNGLARELARKKQYAEALAEYLWMFDSGMKDAPAYAGVRVSFLLGEIAQLAKQYPPAMDALRERRDAAKAKLLESATHTLAATDFDALNRTLGDTEATLAVFDQLPAGDPRRTEFYSLFKPLVDTKRYKEALEVRSFEQMSRNLEMTAPVQVKEIQEQILQVKLQEGCLNVEVLAGVGALNDARALIDRLVKLESSEATKAKLRASVTRAGHPELMPAEVSSEKGKS